GVTIDARTSVGQELIADLVSISDVVAENFAAGVMERMGFGYDQLCQLRDDIIYVSNCGFGHTGPYREFKSWGPIAQAVSGVTHQSGLNGEPPAGWGYSYLDHTGGYYMAMAILMALIHRDRTGQGQWVDMSCTETGAYLHGADLLDHTVNGRSLRADDRPDSNHSTSPAMAPHAVYACQGEDNWVAIACRDDQEWERLRWVAAPDDGPGTGAGAGASAGNGGSGLWDPRFDTLAGRLQHQGDLDLVMAKWCADRNRWDIETDLQSAGIPAAAVRRPGERIDGDSATGSRGLWPMIEHPAMGGVRVDGQPVQFSTTDWSITTGGPTLEQVTDHVVVVLTEGRPAGGDRPVGGREDRMAGRRRGHLMTDLPVSHPTPPPVGGPGPLHGIRVLEIANPFTAFAGKLLADAGADVIVVEPPEGAEQRYNGPMADDAIDGVDPVELSLAWWAENTSKRSAVVDLETGPGRQFFRNLVAATDVLLEATTPGWLAGLGIDYQDLTGDPPVNAELIQVSITPFGRDQAGAVSPAGAEAMTDLTILARGGPMWSCGYDDHDLPPVRGRGEQGLRMAAHFAVMSTLTAILARPRHGGQFVDVSMVAAANVTTEFASYSWLAARETVQRQTGRHAAARPTESTQVRCADGRYLNTGVPPRTPKEFAALSAWMTELGLEDEFPMFSLLAMGSEYQKLTLQ
ncbi:MAG: CoA transferase, partial [Actinomycetota bacterium]